MKKLNSENLIRGYANLLLTVLVLVVFSVAFLPIGTPTASSIAPSPYYRGNADKKQVSLMFNVYENSAVVKGIIDTLDDYGVKATFFIGGCWADDNEVLLVEMANKGYEIGNHGYFHKDHAKLDYKKNKDEIFLTESVIQAFCSVKTNLFAPPSGSFSGDTALACADLGYKMIMWSKDTIDWRDGDSELVFSRATKNLQNGDLILMHPKEHTLKALPKILDYFNLQGFSVVTVSENIEGAV